MKATKGVAVDQQGFTPDPASPLDPAWQPPSGTDAATPPTTPSVVPAASAPASPASPVPPAASTTTGPLTATPAGPYTPPGLLPPIDEPAPAPSAPVPSPAGPAAEGRPAAASTLSESAMSARPLHDDDSGVESGFLTELLNE